MICTCGCFKHPVPSPVVLNLVLGHVEVGCLGASQGWVSWSTSGLDVLEYYGMVVLWHPGCLGAPWGWMSWDMPQLGVLGHPVGCFGHPFGTSLGSSWRLTLSPLSPCRDVALSVAALSFNLWFTKLSCKDFRLVSAGAVALGAPEVARFPVRFSSSLPESGDFRAAALHAQQISDAGGAGAGEQWLESVSEGVARKC